MTLVRSSDLYGPIRRFATPESNLQFSKRSADTEAPALSSRAHPLVSCGPIPRIPGRSGTESRRAISEPKDHHVPQASRSEAMLSALRLVAPGRPLREGLDRILQAKMGALIVVGDGPEVLSLCSGGFLLDAEFTPQRLSELATQ